MSSTLLIDKRAVFVHIAKTAGFSILLALKKNVKCLPYPYRNLKEPISTTSYISGLIPNIWKDYFTFAFVRNPWDWTVSGWLDVTQNRNCYSKPPSFEEFLTDKWKDNVVKNPWPTKFKGQLLRKLESYQKGFQRPF